MSKLAIFVTGFGSLNAALAIAYVIVARLSARRSR